MGLAIIPRWAWIAIGGALALLAFYLTLNAWGNSRYRAGKADADAAWKAASDKLVAQAQNAGTAASTAAAGRAADFASRQEAEKREIERAQENGTSPFDVMFGGSATK